MRLCRFILAAGFALPALVHASSELRRLQQDDTVWVMPAKN